MRTWLHRILIPTLFALVSCAPRPAPSEADRGAQAAMGVISRTLGRTPGNVRIHIVREETDYYATEVRQGVLHVTAGSPTAACRGFYDWVGGHGFGLSTWSVCNIRLPRRLKDEPLQRRDCQVTFRYFMNVCTYGYTTPFWDWKEWERELDRMALHGVNLIPAPMGTEGIQKRVWEQLGLTQEEIDASFCGAAHLPWLREGNIGPIDGPLPASYFEKSIRLQHRILDRMRELHMEPIFMGFRGFVPEALKRHFPDADIRESGWGYSPAYKSHFLDPRSALFQRISALYNHELTAEFGQVKYLFSNCFSQMKLPFSAHGTPERFREMAAFGRRMSDALRAGIPDAVWVLSGWMFGHDRKSWDPESIQALFSDVPDDGMLVLDLASDSNYDTWENAFTWDYAPAFYGKPWVYCDILNFGGRNVPTGNLEYCLNGHLRALASPNRGRLAGMGCAPEGTENNEVVYEIMMDAPWHPEHRDLMQRLRTYSLNRYGACPDELLAFWEGMVKTAYSFTSNVARYTTLRQPFSAKSGRYDLSPAYFKALESFFAAGKTLNSQPAYRTDLAEWAGFYAFGKAELLALETERACKRKDFRAADSLRARFRHAMTDADRFLAAHPLMRLERWTGQARRFGKTRAEKKRYERNARLILTVWGETGENSVARINDYACRMWSGLIRDYYLPRWERWFEARIRGEKPDLDLWEAGFVAARSLSRAKAFRKPLDAAFRMVADYADISIRQGELAGWSTLQLGLGEQRLSFRMPPDWYAGMTGLRFTLLSGEDTVQVDRIVFRGAKKTWLTKETGGCLIGPGSPSVTLALNPDGGGFRKYVQLDLDVTVLPRSGGSAAMAPCDGPKRAATSAAAIPDDAGAVTESIPAAPSPAGTVRSEVVIQVLGPETE